MQRGVLVALLVASLLFAGTVHAQRGVGGFRGGVAPAGVVPRAHPGVRSGFFRGHSRFPGHRNDGSVLFPFWYDEPYIEERVEVPSAPPVVVVQSDKSQPAAKEVVAATPKVIDVPGTTDSRHKALPPAVFVMANGERIVAERYLLTHENLYLTVDRQQRTIPLAMVDLNATVAADRERGIDLRIPADRNEISLSF